MSNEEIVEGFDQDTDESLDINLEVMQDIDRCLILRLGGYVDTYNTGIFQKRIKKVIDRGFVKLVFDCTNLNYFSSTGIGSFTTFLKAVKPLGGDIVLFGMQPKLFEIFHLLGFSQFFSIKQSQNEAMLYIRGDLGIKNSVFPRVISCPICERKLKAIKPGRFRCSQCKTILSIYENGSVVLS